MAAFLVRYNTDFYRPARWSGKFVQRFGADNRGAEVDAPTAAEAVALFAERVNMNAAHLIAHPVDPDPAARMAPRAAAHTCCRCDAPLSDAGAFYCARCVAGVEAAPRLELEAPAAPAEPARAPVQSTLPIALAWKDLRPPRPTARAAAEDQRQGTLF